MSTEEIGRWEEISLRENQQVGRSGRSGRSAGGKISEISTWEEISLPGGRGEGGHLDLDIEPHR